VRAEAGVSFSSARPYRDYVRRVITVLTLAALAAASLPALATAQSNSGVDEYEEVLPNPGGGDNQGGGNDDSTGALSPDQVNDFEEAGPDGAATAELTQESTPESSSPSGGAANGTNSSSGDDSDGVVEVVGDLAGGSDDGMGLLLPIVLGIAAVAAAGFVIARRNRGRADPT
jgi:hypothetical protein